MVDRTLVSARGLGWLALAALLSSATIVAGAIAADPPAKEEIPAEVLEFIEWSEGRREKYIESLLDMRQQLRANPRSQPHLTLKEVEEELRENRQAKTPFCPGLPDPPRVGDRGHFKIPEVTVDQVINDNELLVKIYTTSNKKQELVVCLRGFPTEKLADDQKWVVTSPLVVTGTIEVKDGSRRKLLLVEPFDMTDIIKHYEAAVKQLKREKKIKRG